MPCQEKEKRFLEKVTRWKKKELSSWLLRGTLLKEFISKKDSEKFNEELIYLHLLKRSKKDTNSAPNHVLAKLKREARDEYNFHKKDELWMIIDTDRWKGIPEIITECSKHDNMFVAVSNPCFEFRLLLHIIKDIDDYSEAERLLILENKKINRKKNYIDTKIAEILGSYNKTNPNVFSLRLILHHNKQKNSTQPKKIILQNWALIFTGLSKESQRLKNEPRKVRK